MSGQPVILGTSTTATGAVTAAVLPHTGAMRPLFVVALAVLAFGVVTLTIAGATAFKQARNKA
jgi:hypothetical protein